MNIMIRPTKVKYATLNESYKNNRRHTRGLEKTVKNNISRGSLAPSFVSCQSQFNGHKAPWTIAMTKGNQRSRILRLSC